MKQLANISQLKLNSAINDIELERLYQIIYYNKANHTYVNYSYVLKYKFLIDDIDVDNLIATYKIDSFKERIKQDAGYSLYQVKSDNDSIYHSGLIMITIYIKLFIYLIFMSHYI